MISYHPFDAFDTTANIFPKYTVPTVAYAVDGPDRTFNADTFTTWTVVADVNGVVVYFPDSHPVFPFATTLYHPFDFANTVKTCPYFTTVVTGYAVDAPVRTFNEDVVTRTAP